MCPKTPQPSHSSMWDHRVLAASVSPNMESGKAVPSRLRKPTGCAPLRALGDSLRDAPAPPHSSALPWGTVNPAKAALKAAEFPSSPALSYGGCLVITSKIPPDSSPRILHLPNSVLTCILSMELKGTWERHQQRDTGLPSLFKSPQRLGTPLGSGGRCTSVGFPSKCLVCFTINAKTDFACISMPSRWERTCFQEIPTQRLEQRCQKTFAPANLVFFFPLREEC